jgi:hypothetical protein
MTDKYYFRVRRYLRNRGEQQLDKFQVQLENNINTIIKWDYTTHPRPTLAVLREIGTADVNNEIEKIRKPSYTSDIYTFESQRNNRVQIGANREDFCSNLSENQIQLNRNGFYRITLSGKQITGVVRTEFKLLLKHGEEQPNIIYSTSFATSSSIDYVCLLSTSQPSKLYIQIKIRPDTATYQTSGNILVEFL